MGERKKIALSIVLMSFMVLISICAHFFEASVVLHDELSFLVDSLNRGFQIRQIIVILCLFCYGWIFVCSFFDEKSYKWVFALSLPFSISVWVISAHLMMLVGFKYSSFSICVVMCAILCARYIYLYLHRVKLNFNICVFLQCFFVFIGVASISTSGVLLTYMSADSYHLVAEYGWMFGKHGVYLPYMGDMLTSTGVAPAIISSISYLFGFESVYGIQYCLVFSLVCFLIVVSYSNSTLASSRNKLFVFLIPLMVVFTCGFFYIICGWLISNVYWMIYCTIFCVILLEKNRMFKVDASILLALCSFMMTLCRAEGIIFVSFILACMFDKTKRIYEGIGVMACNIALLGALYSKIFISFKYFSSDFLSIGTALIIIVIVLAALSYLIICQLSCFMQKNNFFLIKYGCIALIPLMAIVKLDQTITNIKMTVMNLGMKDWGWTIWILLIIIVFIIQRGIAYPQLYYSIIGQVVIAFAMNCVRFVPLRYGMGDSYNRLLISIIPLFSVWLSYEFSSLLNENNRHAV